MKAIKSSSLPRVLTALMAVLFLLSFCFAGGSAPETVFISNATELTTALNDASASGDATIIYYTAGTSAIDLSGGVTLPPNVTLDLSAGGGTLRVPSGCTLDVSGTISGGALEISGGTLLRAIGSSVTATITASSGGVVRGSRVLTLENLDLTSGETITGIKYAGLAGLDTSTYVTRAATATLLVRMSGANFTSYQPIEAVFTSADNVFRLGTKNAETLSLAYALTYGGLTGATLPALNPSSYTASDAAIPLNNPTKDGFLFAGWTCEALGVTMPNDRLVIPEGTKGNLMFIAVWMESPTGGGLSNGGTGGNNGENDAEKQQDAQEQPTATPQQNTRHTRNASSSTKVTFTSKADTLAPTAESLRESGSFPWGWVLGGLSAVGILIYFVARRANKRQR